MDTLINKILELLFLYEEVDLKVELSVGAGSVNIAKILRDDLVEDKSAHGSVDDL